MITIEDLSADDDDFSPLILKESTQSSNVILGSFLHYLKFFLVTLVILAVSFFAWDYSFTKITLVQPNITGLKFIENSIMLNFNPQISSSNAFSTIEV